MLIETLEKQNEEGTRGLEEEEGIEEALAFEEAEEKRIKDDLVDLETQVGQVTQVRSRGSSRSRWGSLVK